MHRSSKSSQKQAQAAEKGADGTAAHGVGGGWRPSLTAEQLAPAQPGDHHLRHPELKIKIQAQGFCMS